MNDTLKDMPRLGSEALGPCLGCGKLMLETLPIFYRVTVEQCGIDRREVQAHVGLAMTLGGGITGLALADAMGSHRKPVVIMWSQTGNYCSECADHNLFQILAAGEGK